MTSGIYRIDNVSNGKFYIGSSFDIEGRLYRHFLELNRNRHSNKHLQNAYNKYGEDSFSTEILEVVDDTNNLIKREQYWIDNLEACNNGYNILPNAGTVREYRHSEETRKKISETQRGRKLPNELRVKLSKIREGKKLPIEVREKISNSNLGRKMTEEQKEKLSKSMTGVHREGRPKIPILQYTKDMTFIKEWDSAKDVAREYGNASNIGLVCKGKRKSAYGFVWRYKYSESDGFVAGSKLREYEIDSIKNSKDTVVSLSKKFNVSETTIRKYKNGEW
ncbi:MAG: GIY-YIG nuclease family protein [Psychrobacillus sp.]